MGLRKKVKSLIKDDRPAKLRSLLSSQDADLDDIRFSKRRSALHYCAQFGSVDMMRCLLRLECDPMTRDRDGRLPLHTALYRCLDQDSYMAKQTYDGIICLLVRVSPMSIDVEDKDGRTCHDLLNLVKARLKSYEKGQIFSAGEETEWQKKLADELHFEYEEQKPLNSYIEDFSDQEEQESFSSWSDRLMKEYENKRGLGSEDKKRKQSKTQSQPDPDEDLRKAREEMKKNYKPPQFENRSTQSKLESLLSKKELYEKRFIRFSNPLPARGSVTFGGVPWPCNNVDKLSEILFCDLPDKKSIMYRKFLRKEQVRWHPDKFLQRFRDFLHPNHMDKIMGRVKLISQTLNAMTR